MTVHTVTMKVTTADAGGFTAVASTAELDRDGEIIDPGAFNAGPRGLPPTVPLLAYHNMNDPIGVCRPRYEGGRLLIDARFASTARAQELRTLVNEGALSSVSVGFITAKRRADAQGVTHITAAELLEVSVVAVPSNPGALILATRAAKRLMSDPRETYALLRAELALTRAALITGRPTRPVSPYERSGITPSHSRAQKDTRR